jgi:hypothetical protein
MLACCYRSLQRRGTGEIEERGGTIIKIIIVMGVMMGV